MGLIEALSILGLEYGFSEQDLKAAYRKMARKYHPDIVGSFASGDKMAEINKAYEICKEQMGNSKTPTPDEYDKIMQKYGAMFENMFSDTFERVEKMFKKYQR